MIYKNIIPIATLICAFISSLAAVPLGLKTYEEYKDMKLKNQPLVNEFWRDPHSLDGSYTFDGELIEYLSGFHIGVAKSSRLLFYGLQIISKKFPDICAGNYVMSFEINSNKPFEIHSRLGFDNRSGQPNLFEKHWPIKAIGSWEKLSTDVFTVPAKAISPEKNFLYFQLGRAPEGTKIMIRNITFEKK